MKNLARSTLIALVVALTTDLVQAKGMPGDPDKLFAQLDTLLPTPGVTRAASGAPGAQYWQQRADYRIRVSLDEKRHRLTARQSITYMNRSPDTL
ncbi:MAG: aminopeptidase, partial [Gammaproteobacteria bacterium]